MTNETKLFSANLTIDSMKSSGYRDAAHAVAELIDNSIQAADDTNKEVKVELICQTKSNHIVDRTVQRIEKIAVYDNASGMDEETLSIALAFGEGTRRNAKNGMGKFGFGLPNASVSQCDRVDVYTWMAGRILHSYLSLEEVAEGRDTVPYPEEVSAIPPEWEKLIQSEVGSSGTLIIWSDLARLKWRRHKAFFANTEFIVGRMYRYFLQEEKCSILMSAFDEKGTKLDDMFVRPNDPLYLMSGTNSPKVEVAGRIFDFSEKPAFHLLGEEHVKVKWQGKSHLVKVKASEASAEFRKFVATHGRNPGDTPIGKHATRNQGVSIVRAGRELELNHSFDISYDPVERWWGLEISFEPELDEVFGVTNNKQSATALTSTTLAELAEEEGMSKADLQTVLEADGDPRLCVLKVSEQVIRYLTLIRKNLAEQTKNVKLAKNASSETDPAVEAATKAANADSDEGESDLIDKSKSDEEKKADLIAELESDGHEAMADDDKERVIEAWLKQGKFIFNTASFRGSDLFFDVSAPAGKIKVTFNTDHPLYENLLQPIENEGGVPYDVVRLIFAGWALVEDRLGLDNDTVKKELEDIRKLWGKDVASMLEFYSNVENG